MVTNGGAAKPWGYWETTLTPPTGASDGFVAIVDAAEQAIQNCVDLLATGRANQAEDMLAMLRHEGVSDSDNGSAVLAEYQNSTAAIDRVREQLEIQHSTVNLTAGTSYDTSSAAFTSIAEDEQRLRTELGRSYPLTEQGELPISTEIQLLDMVLDTVSSVHGAVEGTVGEMNDQANRINNSTPDSPSTNSTPGSPSAPAAPMSPAMAPATASTSQNPQYVSAAAPAGAAQPASTATAEDYARYSGSTTVDAAIEEALDALGIHDPEARENWKRGYLVLIERESGGDPNAVNNWDSNAAAGQNSRGLTQTIPATFESYHVPGTSTNINDPTANVAASMNYVMDRYDVAADGGNLQSAVQQTDPGRPAKGY